MLLPVGFGSSSTIGELIRRDTASLTLSSAALSVAALTWEPSSFEERWIVGAAGPKRDRGSENKLRHAAEHGSDSGEEPLPLLNSTSTRSQKVENRIALSRRPQGDSVMILPHRR